MKDIDRKLGRFMFWFIVTIGLAIAAMYIGAYAVEGVW